MCVHKNINNVRVIKYLDLCYILYDKKERKKNYFDFIQN